MRLTSHVPLLIGQGLIPFKMPPLLGDPRLPSPQMCRDIVDAAVGRR
jgi:hypothetical protein